MSRTIRKPKPYKPYGKMGFKSHMLVNASTVASGCQCCRDHGAAARKQESRKIKRSERNAWKASLDI